MLAYIYIPYMDPMGLIMGEQWEQLEDESHPPDMKNTPLSGPKHV